MEVPCVYRDHEFIGGESVYVCEFMEQNISEDIQITPIGSHKLSRRGNKKKNIHVGGVIFNKCTLTKVPQGLTRIFPYMKILSIWHSTLKIVTKNDLAEYKHFERIGICDNEIEFLPGDLLEGFKNLEEVGFNGNELELIEPNILDGLDELKHVSFEENPAYTKCYSDVPGYKSNATLQEVKDELFVRFYRDYKNVEDLLKVEEENQDLKESNKLLRKQIDDQKNQASKSTKNEDIQSDIKRFLQDDETFKDFQIQINDKEFSVHKILLAARSPTLAEILRNNPGVENLNLVDISAGIFTIILKYLYTDELLIEKGTNFLDLYAAAGKLKIEGLKNLAAQKIIDSMKTQNALDVLKLSNKHEHEELRQAAYQKIKNDYPKIDFKAEWSKDVDKMIKVIEAFKMKEEAEENFLNLIKN